MQQIAENGLIPQTRTGALIEGAMEQKGVTIRQLSMDMEMAYEHIRKIVRGMSLPGKPLLKQICLRLGLDYKELHQAWIGDDIHRRFGDIPTEISGKKPGMVKMEQYWDDLSPDHQKDITDMVIKWARQDRNVR
jgi:transcriptional regulator with XRE-family HTH domain